MRFQVLVILLTCLATNALNSSVNSCSLTHCAYGCKTSDPNSPCYSDSNCMAANTCCESGYYGYCPGSTTELCCNLTCNFTTQKCAITNKCTYNEGACVSDTTSKNANSVCQPGHWGLCNGSSTSVCCQYNCSFNTQKCTNTQVCTYDYGACLSDTNCITAGTCCQAGYYGYCAGSTSRYCCQNNCDFVTKKCANNNTCTNDYGNCMVSTDCINSNSCCKPGYYGYCSGTSGPVCCQNSCNFATQKCSLQQSCTLDYGGCLTDSVCLNANSCCQPGYYGYCAGSSSRYCCTERCDFTTKRCSNTTVCTTAQGDCLSDSQCQSLNTCCQPGYYGYCSGSTSRVCCSNSCDFTTRKCANTQMCTYNSGACISNSSCIQDNNCCQPGKYGYCTGSDQSSGVCCQNSCDFISRKCSKTDKCTVGNGACITDATCTTSNNTCCQSGYWGTCASGGGVCCQNTCLPGKCAILSDQCIYNSGSCTLNSTCVSDNTCCQTGQYGYCAGSSPNVCCQYNQTSYWNYHCQSQRTTISTGSVYCNFGSCLNDNSCCNLGYWGYSPSTNNGCTNTCNSLMNCKSPGCSMNTGTCVWGTCNDCNNCCNGGLTQSNCTSQCSGNCFLEGCATNGTCTACNDDFNCCKTGYYGNSCQNICSAGCLNGCMLNGTCNAVPVLLGYSFASLTDVQKLAVSIFSGLSSENTNYTSYCLSQIQLEGYQAFDLLRQSLAAAIPCVSFLIPINSTCPVGGCELFTPLSNVSANCSGSIQAVFAKFGSFMASFNNVYNACEIIDQTKNLVPRMVNDLNNSVREFRGYPCLRVYLGNLLIELNSMRILFLASRAPTNYYLMGTIVAQMIDVYYASESNGMSSTTLALIVVFSTIGALLIAICLITYIRKRNAGIPAAVDLDHAGYAQLPGGGGGGHGGGGHGGDGDGAPRAQVNPPSAPYRADFPRSQTGLNCITCLTDPKVIASIPCGHILFCQTCRLQFEQANPGARYCPECRSNITGFIRIYM